MRYICRCSYLFNFLDKIFAPQITHCRMFIYLKYNNNNNFLNIHHVADTVKTLGKLQVSYFNLNNFWSNFLLVYLRQMDHACFNPKHRTLDSEGCLCRPQSLG